MKQTAAAPSHRSVTRIELWKAIRRVRQRETSNAAEAAGEQAPAGPRAAAPDKTRIAADQVAAERKH